MNPYRYAKALAWSGLFLLAGTIIFRGILGQNIPPYSPALSPDEFAAVIREHARADPHRDVSATSPSPRS